MRAIDLYSGIGGWSLGLKLAGIEVVASYEWWQPAIDTHNGNFGGNLEPVDIRRLKLEDLPSQIDIVVGSPPCTEFSYSNRGGSGNIAEGLKDLVKFFEIVDHLSPSFWAMENVPRVAEVLTKGFEDRKHPLYRFRHLKPHVEIVDFSDFGAPQARRRCIASSAPLTGVKALQHTLPKPTLGDVVSSFADFPNVTDPVWGVTLPVEKVTEREAEAPLNKEEFRMNREAKLYHPVYNNMAFPDPLDEPSRTVTATCTRVSRESVIIEDPLRPGSVRRLTIRERASLQGFPITYQFYAQSFAEKAKMIGNALPPTFTYLLASIAKDGTAKAPRSFAEAGKALTLPEVAAPVTPADREGRTYPVKRSFRAAIHGLRFKSGMRFDLSNDFGGASVDWRVRFYFGPSKDIKEVELDGSATSELRRNGLFNELLASMKPEFLKAASDIASVTPTKLQSVWSHKSEGLGPYEVVDLLGELADRLHGRIDEELEESGRQEVEEFVLLVTDGALDDGKRLSERKLRRNAMRILTGLIVGDWFNTLEWHREQRKAA